MTAAARGAAAGTPGFHDFEANGLDGRPRRMADFRGRHVLVVNVASRCGFTPQYAGLEALHREFAPRGLVVLGFPCNQFGGQEPGDAAAIGAFCRREFGVSFPLFEKIEVKGPGAHPIFRFLVEARPGFLGTRAIKWNFTKFLVDPAGRVVDRFGPATSPARIARHLRRRLA